MSNFKLSFSGGGFRATFFCLGAYRRLVQLGVHSNVSHISSVSGGSITAGAIMLALSEGDFKDINDFDDRVTKILKELGQSNFRNQLIRSSLHINIKNFKPELPRTRFSRLLPEILDHKVFKGKYMKELPSFPEWSCNATCLNTMKRFRFKPTDMYANLLGYCYDIDDITVSQAVASSAAFPMLFAPFKLNVKNKCFIDIYNGNKVNKLDNLYLTDGGVYDNLGSENLLKETTPFVIVDASATERAWPLDYKPSYFSKLWRILNVSMSQIVLLRRRLIFQQSNSHGIQLLINKPISDIVKSEQKSRNFSKELPEYPSYYSEIENRLASLRTDLDYFHKIEIDLLMWAGAIKADFAIKALLPKLINHDYWRDIPKFPEYSQDEIDNVLNMGKDKKLIRRNL